jgi:serine/threonine-protein kinase
MDDDVRELVRQERIVEAAELASGRGDGAAASALFERACDWSRAAIEAERSGDQARALTLAVTGRDEAIAERVLSAVVATQGAAERVAYQLETRGAHAWSARLLEAIGKLAEAARGWERAGEAVRAAALLERARDVVGAARVLEAALRREPTRWPLHVALGALLLRYGKLEAAVRTLQKVAPEAPERRDALTHLAEALGRLGLDQARHEALRELDALGGPLERVDAPSSHADVRARLFGRYEILREVAQSPTARVVECIDRVRGEHVAVKIFAGYDARGGGRDALSRFEREVKALAALDHPNVVPLRDYIAEGPAIVLAWMAGGTLDDLMAKGPIVPARAVEIASSVLRALGESHRLGIVHRDVKPANVLFDDAGTARLGDFGVAHLGDLSATATAAVIGTLGYMSPEQREGRPAGVASDLYGVGAILYEMLTGEKPSANESPRTSPSGVHRDLDARHDRMLATFLAIEPADRPPDAFAARKTLTSLAWPSTVEPAAPKPRREHAPTDRPSAARVLVRPDGQAFDTWTGHALEIVAMSDAAMARASAFSRANHPALQAVLRVDRAHEEIWLAKPLGGPARAKLSPAQLRTAQRALEALHAAGTVHGHVDGDHVFVDEHGGVTIRFALEADPTASLDTDRLALARLG